MSSKKGRFKKRNFYFLLFFNGGFSIINQKKIFRLSTLFYSINKKTFHQNYCLILLTRRQSCGSGSGVFAWIWIRIWFSNFSGSGSGFQISLNPDPVQPRFWNKKNCRKVSKSDLSEENFKIMIKDRQKIKKATFYYYKSS